MEIYGMNRNSLEEGVPRPPSGRACAKALWQEGAQDIRGPDLRAERLEYRGEARGIGR